MIVEALKLSRQQIKLKFFDNFNLGGKDKIKYFVLISSMHFPKLIFFFLLINMFFILALA